MVCISYLLRLKTFLLTFFISWYTAPKNFTSFRNLLLLWIGFEFGCHEAVIVHFTQTSAPILLLSRIENLAWKSFFIRSSRTFSCMITKRRCMKNIWWTLKYMLASNSSITMHKVFFNILKIIIAGFWNTTKVRRLLRKRNVQASVEYEKNWRVNSFISLEIFNNRRPIFKPT